MIRHMPPEPPLPTATFYILFALASGQKHGYAILKEARELAEDAFRIGPATLYTTIQRLVETGWIAPVETAHSDDARRRYYRLTSSGRKAVRNEIARMELLVNRAKVLRPRLTESAS